MGTVIINGSSRLVVNNATDHGYTAVAGKSKVERDKAADLVVSRYISTAASVRRSLIVRMADDLILTCQRAGVAIADNNRKAQRLIERAIDRLREEKKATAA